MISTPRPVCYLTATLACVTFLFLPSASVGTESNVYVEPSVLLVNQTLAVPAGRFASYKLSLKQGTVISAAFTVDGGLDNKVNVLLLDLNNFQRYSSQQQFSAFKGTAGTIQGIANYTFKIPETNLYYLLIDNRRSGLFSRNVTIYSFAILPEPTDDSLKQQRGLQTLYQQLKQLFVFQDFRIALRHCGLENAFSDRRTGSITLCKELAEKLSGQGLSKAMGFVLFHELGHSLLNLWGYPLSDNEDVADEFATVFMLLAKQDDMALEAAHWWASETPRAQKEQAIAKLWQDDRHTLSPQRARNIVRWLNQRDALLRQWQKVFVPNMQINALAALEKSTDNWIDHDLIRSELIKRNPAQK